MIYFTAFITTLGKQYQHIEKALNNVQLLCFTQKYLKC